MKLKCCNCGCEIDEFDEKAILDVPFGEGVVHFCSEECKKKACDGL